jgi:hypothetical protein
MSTSYHRDASPPTIDVDQRSSNMSGCLLKLVDGSFDEAGDKQGASAPSSSSPD